MTKKLFPIQYSNTKLIAHPQLAATCRMLEVLTPCSLRPCVVVSHMDTFTFIIQIRRESDPFMVSGSHSDASEYFKSSVTLRHVDW